MWGRRRGGAEAGRRRDLTAKGAKIREGASGDGGFLTTKEIRQRVDFWSEASSFAKVMADKSANGLRGGAGRLPPTRFALWRDENAAGGLRALL